MQNKSIAMATRSSKVICKRYHNHVLSASYRVKREKIQANCYSVEL